MKQLACPLCRSQLQAPKMCPHCSQVYCHACIRSYLARQHFSPCCNEYIIDIELVDCSRLVSQLQQVVQSKVRNRQQAVALCQTHGLELGYFCRDCFKWICSDCGVIQVEHRGHRLVTRAEAQTQAGKKIDRTLLARQIVSIQGKLKSAVHKKNRCLMDLELYRSELKWSKARIEKYCQQLVVRLEAEGEKQLRELDERVAQYQAVIKGCAKNLAELQAMLKPGSSLQKIKQSLSQKPNVLYQKPESEEEQQDLFLSKVNKIQVVQEIFPNFSTFTYEFDYQNLRDDSFHYSSYFERWGQNWRLKIYPRGNSTAAGRYLSIFLELVNCLHVEKPQKYVYKIELLSLNRAGSTVVKEYASTFDTGESWGYTDYLSLSQLEQYLHNGKLLFSVGIRNQSYQGLCSDLKKYISKVEDQNRVLSKLICDGAADLSASESSRMHESFCSQLSSINMDGLSDLSIGISS